jgi:hypothetical protein
MFVSLTCWTRQRIGLVGLVMIVSIATLLLLSARGDANGSSNGEIARAATAPYMFFLQEDSKALCGAFTSTAADYLAFDADSKTCVTGMEAEFASHMTVAVLPTLTGTKRLKVSHVSIYGDRAVAEVLYYDRGVSSMTLDLERVSGKWRVSTRPLLTILKGCLSYVVCPQGAHTLLFAIRFPGRIQFVKHAEPKLLRGGLSKTPTE